jgi:putative chitinase
MPTEAELAAIMPALPAAKRQLFLPVLQQAIEEFDILSAARQAAFLAQLAHESGQFRFMEEIWGPTPAQQRYEPVSTLATRLGNTAPGDGRRFKGRGPIQLTGRANYQRFGAVLGLDLVSEPERAATPPVAFRIAGLFWQRNGLNELADQATADAFKQITRRINGGVNGLADRERFYAQARRVLGVPDVMVPATRSRGPVPAGATREAPAATTPFERGAEAIRTGAKSKAVKGGRTVAKPAAKTPRTRAATKTAVKKTAAKKIAVRKPHATNAGARRARATAASPAPRRRLAKKR